MLWARRALARAPRQLSSILQARPSSSVSEYILMERISASLSMATRDAQELAKRLHAQWDHRSLRQLTDDDLYEPLHSDKTRHQLVRPVEDEEEAQDTPAGDPGSYEEPLYEADLRAELEGWERPVLTTEQIKALGLKYYSMTTSTGSAIGPLLLRHSLVDLNGAPIGDVGFDEARQCRDRLLRDILEPSKSWGFQDAGLKELSIDYLEKNYPEFAYCPAEKGAFLDAQDKPIRHLARWKASQFLHYRHKYLNRLMQVASRRDTS
ncbi:Proteophosphoglycan ppg4 [Rhodotorula toruloides ATCC 204091]|uniref:Proteophosphoglycan ppg4 n=1 Tax=Rhodotorula toruloides TaxID=5286 RepID=A0A0K3CLM1_RHOTO|nr:Proteophosphoglycan ppg4 [Rhodotorula toruloides ATCC 204091]KAK4330515.1 Proteophosphoglycan ppg4 [Rhodotorula toruloides]PRQ71184.1 Proteophosphoglycan ppg4 [Rhodotorula toruloides]